ncbi:MAG: alpha/beta fold hydrolase [Myxococcota bacterium]
MRARIRRGASLLLASSWWLVPACGTTADDATGLLDSGVEDARRNAVGPDARPDAVVDASAPDAAIPDAMVDADPPGDGDATTVRIGPNRVDHFLRHETAAPGYEGELWTLFLREREPPWLRAGQPAQEGQVVLFVHGATGAGEPLWDPDIEGYSFLDAAARAGFDAFSIDLTGYGRSTRPPPMDDPCNVPWWHRSLVPACAGPRHTQHLTTTDTDVDDLLAALAYLRRLRGVDTVSLIGLSQGGLRVLHFASLHPELIHRVVATGISGSGRLSSADPPADVPATGPPMVTNTCEEFVDRITSGGCRPDQTVPEIMMEVCAESLRSDPIGSGWGPGFTRSPGQTTWGYAFSTYQALTAPTLLVTGACDPLTPDIAHVALFDAIGSTDKVRMVFDGAGHVFPYETQVERFHAPIFGWLETGAFEGTPVGEFSISFAGVPTRID